jgi:predicted lactoylglutathione lyase
VPQRVSVVTLGVADLKRSREFYERLGWRRSMAQAEGVVFFQVRDANIADDGHAFSGISLSYNARSREEVDSVQAEAEAAGARLLKPAWEAFWGGYAGCFADPDGFLWEVAWNPSFPIAEDGGIQIPD